MHSRGTIDPDVLVPMAVAENRSSGEFAIDGSRPAADLDSAYGLILKEEEAAMSIADLVVARLGGRAEYADRLTIGPIELIVRDVDEHGAIKDIGLSVEPHYVAPKVPVFLSPGEMWDQTVSAWRGWREAGRQRRLRAKEATEARQREAGEGPNAVLPRDGG